ncbi:hypothetical protein [Streptomyces oceani]|uniref:hypothetical protein n=1 Tax=Streptomyces oceani TaxID=1075402 RepID=UPI001FCD64B9|nr:hypothetical protein [Streptomyces oceani]
MLPVGGSSGMRIGVLGESLFGRVLACRMIAVGIQVTAATRGPVLWRALSEAAGSRLVLGTEEGSWPPHPPRPPGVGQGPQGLVSDVRRPPPVSAGGGSWCTVVHVRREAPRHGSFWRTLDALLTLGTDFAETVGPVAGEQAVRVTSSLRPGEIALFRAGGARVLRPDVSPAEAALLTVPSH